MCVCVPRLLVAEHQRFETLLEYLHDKLKKKFENLAEKRDSMLKSDKIKTKSFEDLQHRFVKMQEAATTLHKVCVCEVCVCGCVHAVMCICIQSCYV